ncbi:MAG: LuxR C-terminal-related transcriptional regulator, partial [Wenzhouxiangellaceae bacterium]
GRSNKEIAGALGVSAKTVEAHRARVMDKMRAGSLAELVRMALIAITRLAERFRPGAASSAASGSSATV